MDFIDLKAQYKKFEPAIRERIDRVLEHGRFIMGPEVEELEAVLANYVGCRHAITVASGTDSLEIALRALEIGPGDEVLTVPFTWISTAEVVLQVGAKPVFVDIDPLDFNIAVEQIEAAITPRTKALLPVSLFGQMPDYDAINAIAAKHGITVIEDAAQSFGATRHGGIRRHYHDLVGMNGRFDTLQAAIMLGKWPGFTDEVVARGQLGARYTEKLQDVCKTPEIREGNTHVYAQYTLRVPDRDALGEKLKAKGVPTAVYYPKCLHEQPVFSHLGYSYGDFPAAEAASREVISLPLNPYLTEAEQDFVINGVRESLNL